MAIYHSPEVGTIFVADPYLAPRIQANHDATIPWSLQACRDTGRIDAFKLQWKTGDPKMPHIFWDSDVAKVLEGMAFQLMLAPDPEMEAELNEIVELVVAAQQPDGYLNTHFTVVEPEKRFAALNWAHELYCAGHLIEAAIAHYKATGRRNFLDCICRYADYIDSVFGRGKGKRRGYPGHEEIELALCSLAAVTGRRKYLKLAAYFIDERGRKPNYYVEKEGADPNGLVATQAEQTVRERKEAVGHSVRMMYLACGMADVADATGDVELLARCEDIAENVRTKKMFITGGVGSTRNNEAFEHPYKLDNLECYAESCAAIGLVLFLRRLHNITGDGRHIDVLERALYNGVLAGIDLAGDHFFYQNPLRSSVDSPFVRERQSWFGCSCCPTNFCRFLPQVGSLLWSASDTEVRLNIPTASTYHEAGRAIRVSGGYPYDGHVKIEFLADGEFAFSLRIPGWCRSWTLARNGRRLAGKDLKAKLGFVTLKGPWKAGDALELALDMPVEAMRANRKVEDDAGKIALVRGPLVYALESVDNGDELQSLLVPAAQPFRLAKAKGLPKGTVAITGDAWRDVRDDAGELYTTAAPKLVKKRFTAIPFALWQNRGPAEMAVWIREK